MDVPSMVHRSGNTLIVRSVVSGNQIYIDDKEESKSEKLKEENIQEEEEKTEIFDKYSLECFQQIFQTENMNIEMNKNENDVNRKENNIPIEIKDEQLPQCKIKRNYSCNSCTFFTQNPRYFLTHLRDKHGEKIVINECKLCLYASRHYQKLVRHMKMVHGSTAGIKENGYTKKKKFGRETRKRKVDNKISNVQLIPKNENNLQYLEKPSQTPQEHSNPDTNFYKEFNVDEFLDETSKNRVLNCKLCDFTTIYRSLMIDHETEDHVNAKFFKCEKCSYITHIKARFSKHVKYHSMPMIKCIKCDFRTPYKWNLDRHMKNHGGNGAFNCSACNFTADIKQSLTVHEMNHHVPPVGHAVGMNNVKRKNKVGGTDNTEIINDFDDVEKNSTINNYNKKDIFNNITKKLINQSHNNNNDKNNNLDNQINSFDDNVVCLNNHDDKNNLSEENNNDERNDNFITKNDDFSTPKKCKYNVEETFTSDADNRNFISKKNRPIPNLIPIQSASKTLINKKSNEKDLLSKDEVNNMEKIAAILFDRDVQTDLMLQLPKVSNSFFERKSKNLFDLLKHRFANENEVNLANIDNLTCSCGHSSKSLSEFYIHHSACQNLKNFFEKELYHIIDNSTDKLHINNSSTRCQYCRHRCKSSADLKNHLKNCSKIENRSDSLNEIVELEENNKSDDEIDFILNETKHPMENKVFIWNNIETENKLSYVNSSDSPIIFDDKKNLNGNGDSSNPSNLVDQNFNIENNDEISYYDLEKDLGYPGEVSKSSTFEEEINNNSLKKVYKCPHCYFWASTASRFHVHIVGHLNKKPFECSLCNYRSNWRWDITKHIRLKTMRDPSHKNAKVLMNDETGRRNYTKYNKYITLMKVTDEDGDPKLMKSGEMTPNQEASLSFFKDFENKVISTNNDNNISADIVTNVLNPQLNNKINETKQFSFVECGLPGTIDATETVDKKQVEENQEKNKLFRCKECNFKHADRDMLVTHVKQHKLPFNNIPNDGQHQLTTSSLPFQIQKNYSNVMCDMLALLFNQQQMDNMNSENSLFQSAQKFASLNLNLVPPFTSGNNQGSKYETQNEPNVPNFEGNETNCVQVVPTTLSPNNISILNENSSANNLVNTKTQLSRNTKNRKTISNYSITAFQPSSSKTMVIGNSNCDTNTSLIGGSYSNLNVIGPNPTIVKNENLKNMLININNSDNRDNENSENKFYNSHNISNNNDKNNYINNNNNNNLNNNNNNNSNNNNNNKNDNNKIPAPYRCGHCHQFSNWKHVIQRHCRLKHKSDIRIDAFDRSSDSDTPIYRPINRLNNQLGRRSSQNMVIHCDGKNNSSKNDGFLDTANPK